MPSVIIKDTARPALAELAQRTTPERMAAFIGPRVQVLVQKNFLAQPKNKDGYPSTGFWAEASDATHWSQVPDGVVITVSKIGVRQRLEGGPIKPVNGAFLTIPICAEAYGKTTRDFAGELFKVRSKKTGKSFLARKDGKNLEYLFFLSPGVVQDGNPNVLPSDLSFYRAAMKGARLALGIKSAEEDL